MSGTAANLTIVQLGNLIEHVDKPDNEISAALPWYGELSPEKKELAKKDAIELDRHRLEENKGDLLLFNMGIPKYSTGGSRRRRSRSRRSSRKQRKQLRKSKKQRKQLRKSKKQRKQRKQRKQTNRRR